MVGVDDLARLAAQRVWERLSAGTITVNIKDAATLMRLAAEVEHDRALVERDAALALVAEWKHGLRLIRDAVVRQHGQPAWAAISAEVNRARPDRC